MQIANLDLLENAQFTPEQARAVLQVMDNSAKEQGHSTATKGDLLEVKNELRQTENRLELKIETVKSDLKAGILAVKADLQKAKGDLEVKIEQSANRMIMWILGGGGLIAVLLRYLPVV